MTVTSSPTQLVDVPINQPEQARLGHLSLIFLRFLKIQSGQRFFPREGFMGILLLCDLFSTRPGLFIWLDNIFDLSSVSGHSHRALVLPSSLGSQIDLELVQCYAHHFECHQLT